MKSTLELKRFASLVFITCVLHLPAGLAQQSAGVIQGMVVTSEGDPVISANVLIKELARGAVVSETGSFVVRNIPPGTYTVVVSSLGFGSVIQTIQIKQGEVVSQDFTLTEKPVDLPEMVVTGTRSEKVITNVPVPTSVISERQIKAQSAVGLDDLLAEQQGMFIDFNQWGVGIQVEGLDPAYTLILVDGEPVVGRTAGTLELTRLSLGNIQRVEVVKGPSSSLYGSDALAAVINLITKQPTAPLNGSLRTRYGSFNNLDVSGDIEAKQGQFGASVFIERNSSDGYDLTPETPSKTMPRHTNYTVNPKLVYDLSEQTKINISGRFVTQNFSNIASVLAGGLYVNLDDRSTVLDWSVAPSIIHRFSPNTKFELRLYQAEYKTDDELTYQTDRTVFDRSAFKQTYNKVDGQFDDVFSKTMNATLGGGYVYETVLADRISGQERSADSHFAFGQQEWIPEDALDFIVSFRYDAHRDYAARLSPKVSALAKPFSWLSVRASVGNGFKAPTFQQLYLDFTNSQVGYSVLGSANVKEAFQRLEQTGQVQSVLIDPNSLEMIRPENSVAYNADVEINLLGVTFQANVFRNNLKDLIEAAPFATKNNGQPVYTYFNISKVFTQGLNAGVSVKLFSSLSFSVSYQYLEAKDQNVLDDVRAGKIFKIGSTGRVRPVQESEYGGLFNRSAHSGTVKVAYVSEERGLTISLRGVLRGRYGFADKNGNNILDDDSEYAPGYALWNATISKRIFDFLTLQAGVDDMLNVSNKDYTPFIPGRVVYAGMEASF